jgi:hypothetical protein
LRVHYYGPDIKPEVRLTSEVPEGNLGTTSSDQASFMGCNILMTSTEYITNCNDLAFTATNNVGGDLVTAVVTPGGSYDATDGYESGPCWDCCRSTDEIPDEISVQFTKHPDLPEGAKYLNPQGSAFPGDVLIESGVFVLTLKTPISPGAREWQFSPPNGVSGPAFGVAMGGCYQWPYNIIPSFPSNTISYFYDYLLPIETHKCEVSCLPRCYVVVGNLGNAFSTCESCLDTPLCRPPQGLSGSVGTDYEFMSNLVSPPVRIVVPGSPTTPAPPPGTPLSIGTIEVL